jgi:hypothetical protein
MTACDFCAANARPLRHEPEMLPEQAHIAGRSPTNRRFARTYEHQSTIGQHGQRDIPARMRLDSRERSTPSGNACWHGWQNQRGRKTMSDRQVTAAVLEAYDRDCNRDPGRRV